MSCYLKKYLDVYLGNVKGKVEIRPWESLCDYYSKIYVVQNSNKVSLLTMPFLANDILMKI